MYEWVFVRSCKCPGGKHWTPNEEDCDCEKPRIEVGEEVVALSNSDIYFLPGEDRNIFPGGAKAILRGFQCKQHGTACRDDHSMHRFSYVTVELQDGRIHLCDSRRVFLANTDEAYRRAHIWYTEVRKLYEENGWGPIFGDRKRSMYLGRVCNPKLNKDFAAILSRAVRHLDLREYAEFCTALGDACAYLASHPEYVNKNVPPHSQEATEEQRTLTKIVEEGGRLFHDISPKRFEQLRHVANAANN